MLHILRDNAMTITESPEVIIYCCMKYLILNQELGDSLGVPILPPSVLVEHQSLDVVHCPLKYS